jgi:hypothetical protein
MRNSSWIKKRKAATQTSSWLRAWYLNRFRGYRIIEETLRPHRGMFGRISYVRIWFLTAGRKAR